MDTLVQIRDSFIADCSELLKVSRAYDTFAHITPDFRSHPEKLGFEPHIPSLTAMYEMMAKSPDLIQRMIHSQMIQEWHLFLGKVFKRRLFEVFSGGESDKVEIDVRLTLPEDARADLAETVQRRALQSFSEKSYESRLKKVLKLLGKPVSADDENLRVIKKHKVIRDVIQHNKGELRLRDFQELGVSELTLAGDTVDARRTYKVGDTISITHHEIYKLAMSLSGAARALIPDVV